MSNIWDEDRVRWWLDQAEGLDRQLAPVTEALFAAAGLGSGQRVLDVGCGHGPTTRRAATEVGPAGAVTGVDVAEAMLQAGASVAPAEGAAPVEWLHADVERWDPSAEGQTGYDAVISRFGVMFFTDAEAAFTNLAAAVAPGGHMAIATWTHRDRCDLFEVPLHVTLGVLEAKDIEVDEAGGAALAVPGVDEAAFSLGTPERIAEVLAGAGWTDVETVEHRADFRVHGGLGPAAAARAALDLGPTRVLMSAQPEELRTEVAEAIARAYEDHTDQHGHVRLGATFLVTTAHRS